MLRPCSIEHILIKKLLHWVAFLYGFYPELKSALWLQRAFLLRFYRSQFWRLQKLAPIAAPRETGFMGHNFGDYKNLTARLYSDLMVLSVTILETTKTDALPIRIATQFYRSRFWRLQKRPNCSTIQMMGFIGHDFGDYKNVARSWLFKVVVLSVTILETTKTVFPYIVYAQLFYRSRFWRLQKPTLGRPTMAIGFIGHDFGDYKNVLFFHSQIFFVLSVTILETTKTQSGNKETGIQFYRSRFWRLQKPQMVSANYTIKVRSYLAWKAE